MFDTKYLMLNVWGVCRVGVFDTPVLIFGWIIVGQIAFARYNIFGKKYGEIDGIPSTSPHPGVNTLTVYRRENESGV